MGANKKDIKESTDSNNITIEDDEAKLDRIGKHLLDPKINKRKAFELGTKIALLMISNL